MWWLIGIVAVAFLWWKYNTGKRDREAEETVVSTSTKFEELNELAKGLILYDICLERCYTVVEKSKQKVENFDADKCMRNIVARNADNFALAAQQVLANNICYGRYEEKFAEICNRPSQYVEDIRCQKKENELCRNLKRWYNKEFNILLKVSYTSPKGRNHYERNFSIDFDTLCEIIRYVKPGWKLTQDVVPLNRKTEAVDNVACAEEADKEGLLAQLIGERTKEDWDDGEGKSKETVKRNEGMVCDDCHIIYYDDFIFCPECGKPLHAGIGYTKCEKCGFDFEDDMYFCPQCGNKLPVKNKVVSYDSI